MQIKKLEMLKKMMFLNNVFFFLKTYQLFFLFLTC